MLSNPLLKPPLKVSPSFNYNFLETLVIDLDNCLLNAVYKKKELIDYDATTYVKLIG